MLALRILGGKMLRLKIFLNSISFNSPISYANEKYTWEYKPFGIVVKPDKIGDYSVITAYPYTSIRYFEEEYVKDNPSGE